MMTTLLMFPLALAILAVAAAWREYRVALRTMPSSLMVICPEDQTRAEVRIDPRLAARAETFAIPLDLRLASCSHWPERGGCDQRCLRQIAPGHTEIARTAA